MGQNGDIVRVLFNAFNARDFAAAAKALHPDMKMDATRAPFPELARVYHGLRDVARFWAGWYEAWGSVNTDEPEVLDAGEQVVAWTKRQAVRGRASGIEVEVPEFGWVLSVREGKVVRATVYLDREEALEAAGLRE